MFRMLGLAAVAILFSIGGGTGGGQPAYAGASLERYNNHDARSYRHHRRAQRHRGHHVRWYWRRGQWVPSRLMGLPTYAGPGLRGWSDCDRRWGGIRCH